MLSYPPCCHPPPPGTTDHKRDRLSPQEDRLSQLFFYRQAKRIRVNVNYNILLLTLFRIRKPDMENNILICMESIRSFARRNSPCTEKKERKRVKRKKPHTRGGNHLTPPLENPREKGTAHIK